jgi:FkbM family methyltransferase
MMQHDKNALSEMTRYMLIVKSDDMIKTILRSFMRISRKCFRNTPIQRLRITTFIYKHVARTAFKAEIIEVSFRGARILYPGGDYTTLPSLVDGVYEKNELNALMKHLDGMKSPINAVDIGANVGIWTVLLAKHENVRQVFAFEPSPLNVSLLRSNIELNHLEEKVVIIESAVADTDGQVRFEDTGSGATKRISQTASSFVSSVSLDSYLNGAHVDLIKIDVEGYEPIVLNGSWNTIEATMPTLFIEYSLPQVFAAGLTWKTAGERLCNLYGKYTVITDAGIKTEEDFDAIAKDNRLLNLLFTHPETK